MADIRVLMVFDGGRLNFGPAQTSADTDNFGASQLYNALTGSTTPTIQVDRVHRRGHLFNTADLSNSDAQLIHENCSLNLDLAGDFVFALPHNPPATMVTADLSRYDVLWIIGDEGNNGTVPGVFTIVNGHKVAVDAPITDDEKIAIAQFMESQGGVFATGDHDAIGFMMSGALPRVRTMRRWYEYDQGDGGGPAVSVGNGQKFGLNWSGYGLLSGQSITDRNDTLIVDASGNGLFYFNGQSDQRPQTLVTTAGTPLAGSPALVHGLLRDANGQVIGQFPDHMHEGIATDFTTVSGTGSPFDPNVSPSHPYSLTFNGAVKGMMSFEEFPSPDGYQPQPEVIAYTRDSGHTTSVPNGPGGSTLYPATNPKTATGAVSTYDGRAVGKGRVVTGSTFHHYLDKNLLGDPGTQAQPSGTVGGNGPTGADTGFTNQHALLDSIDAYYINVVTWLARPSSNFQFWVLKSTYGAHESLVATQGFPDAFYLVVEGYSPNKVGANPQISLSGPLAADGVSFTQGTPQPDDPGSPNTAQRILIPFSANPIPSGAFPAPGGAPKVLALEARLTIGSDILSAEALFELTASADPFFANVGATHPPNPGYLSQDLRVFQFAPKVQSAPIISFHSGWTGHDYMTHLLSFLNDPSNHYTNGANDPFGQLQLGNDLTEFSSVTPTTNGSPNLPFALARVRLKNTVAATAPNVRVFFRLFTTASNDTDFDPVVTYPSNLDAANLPGAPVPGLFGTTFPMTASPAVSSDYPGPNQINVSVAANAETYAYFGCFLDVYGPSSPIPAGGHHCLVAQIAYDEAPIVNSNGLTLNPENSDKLAQRNIAVIPSGFPSGPAAHRVPQTFDTRPSLRTGEPVQKPAGYPDELMIDWGEVPIGSEASLYWPQAAAIDVVRLATLLYPSHNLTVTDARTVQCTVTSRLTYVPIPFGEGPKLAGLFTIDLPPGVRRGREFTIVVRRISTRRASQIGGSAANVQARSRRARTSAANASTAATAPLNTAWRYVVGTFQVTIPVDAEERLLWPEENILAIFKWRLQQWSPVDRWYPVLQRYVGYLAGRVDAFGGNAAGIAPSPTGVPAPHGHGHGARPGETEFTGKVADVFFDRFGDFEGFELQMFVGRHAFHSREPAIGTLIMRALRERLLLSVIAEAHPPHAIRGIIVRV
jgi:hypothetical protein